MNILYPVYICSVHTKTEVQKQLFLHVQVILGFHDFMA